MLTWSSTYQRLHKDALMGQSHSILREVNYVEFDESLKLLVNIIFWPPKIGGNCGD